MVPRILAVLLCLPLLAFAPAPFLKPRTPPAVPLAGWWEEVSFQRFGGRLENPSGTDLILIEDGLLTFYSRTKWKPEKSQAYKMAHDPKAIPRILDLGPTDRDSAFDTLGIYKIEGDLLVWTFISKKVGGRPTGFELERHGQIFRTFRRLKTPPK